ncbi:protein DpdJ [Actinokineospora pegani]|uniref:protein DpdJ n=1 Tax=Actinokineospora pegani TaxID=2654637 RepID=UPI0012E9D3B0|nr:protein DpdJ [Actinokineospora pegani]
MSTSISTDALMRALDVIEEAETRNLAWGLFDESWTRDGLLDLLAARWQEGSAEECLDRLVEEQLLLQLPASWPQAYRTRMSETVRLFSKLRQLFPNQPWQTGARLVSDIRFTRQPRMFSERDIAPDACVERLAQLGVPETVLVEVRRVLGGRKLSRFQLAATAAVVNATRSSEDRGVVVSAGTGSGKTLAFYLPALSRMSAEKPASGRAVAIYPRNELLKDQFATALAEIRRLRQAGGRQLTIGAYFGPTPFSVNEPPPAWGGWRKRGKRYICPFLTCPSLEDDGSVCAGELSWDKPRNGDDVLNWGRLVCLRCEDAVTGDELRLTRTSIQRDQPDILFTTTEMLNQQLSDGWSRHVFGAGGNSKRKPNLVLLDEIHTFTGTSGAQAAFLLRRWRKLLGTHVTWVGLSATLANAATFFADLCGLNVDSIEDIRPADSDLKPHGSEYQLLLRGDPASQSALLSTTIQSLMLLRRVLGPRGSTATSPYGSRVFAFLENLDLVNRLYRQVLSAEGRNPFGEVDTSKKVLAALRSDHVVPGDERMDRDSEGQYWWLPSLLGFEQHPLQISRTSSQDSGVDSSADVIVATSSLEVGYDDPRVGGVLQHKAPRDIAQFLQRRGRAGRVQSQRPWTVVVLSDYGRDRLAFQSYESILDPSVPAKSLPLGNQSVRKMQAAMCLVDWIAIRLSADGNRRWDARKLLREPNSENQAIARRCAELLHEVLEGGQAQHDLVAFVRESLRLSDDEAASVCWEHPRSLLLEVVPTAYRRLASQWAAVDETRQLRQQIDTVARQPLPEYIPKTLFSDLELPEVEVAPPDDYDPAADTSLPVGMGLSELAPGKVTLRWAVQKVRGLWVEVPPGGVVDLDDRLAPGGEVLRDVDSPAGLVPLVRPIRIRPESPSKDIDAASNARLRWRYLIDEGIGGTALPRARNSPLGDLVAEVTAFLNIDRGPLRTWRYALDGTAEIVTRSGGRVRQDYTFTRNGSPAAVGFASTVDALVVVVHAPASIESFDLLDDPDRLRQLRTDRFQHLAVEGLTTRGLNPFAAGWVTDVAVSVAAQAVLHGGTAQDLVTAPLSQWKELAEQVVDGVLLATSHTDLEQTPLRDVVLDTLSDPQMTDVLRAALSVLVTAPDVSWLPWLRARFLQTVAAAWQSAAQQVCLDFNVDTDALVDVVDEGGLTARVVLSDSVPGGGGLVETLVRRISDDPRRFDTLVATATEASDTEEVDPSLRRALGLLGEDVDVAAAAEAFRSAPHNNRLALWQNLINMLADKGISRTRMALSALSARVFRPGSSRSSDKLLRTLLDQWDAIDLRAGFAIDHRSVCAFLAEDGQVLAALQQLAGSSTGDDRRARAQSVLLSLLWTRACARRPETLRASNRFVANPPATERTFVEHALPGRPKGVDVDRNGWREDLIAVLRTWGEARVFSTKANASALSAAVRSLIVDPLEVDWLHAYPKVTGAVRDGGRHSVSVTLQEAPQ